MEKRMINLTTSSGKIVFVDINHITIIRERDEYERLLDEKDKEINSVIVLINTNCIFAQETVAEVFKKMREAIGYE